MPDTFRVCLFVFSRWRGRQKKREEWLKRWPVFMFVSGFPSLFSPQSHNSFSFFSETLPTPPTLKYNSSRPGSTAPPPTTTSSSRSRRPSVHLPTPSVPPVFVLRSDSWRAPSGRRGEGKPFRWAGRKERLWCSESFLFFWGGGGIFHHRALKPRRLSKLYQEKGSAKLDRNQRRL